MAASSADRKKRADAKEETKETKEEKKEMKEERHLTLEDQVADKAEVKKDAKEQTLEETLREKAESKDAKAEDQFLLAEYYREHGEFVKARDLCTLITNTHQRTDLTDPVRFIVADAFNLLGEMHESGEGVTKKSVLAARDYYNKAVVRGSIVAQVNLQANFPASSDLLFESYSSLRNVDAKVDYAVGHYLYRNDFGRPHYSEAEEVASYKEHMHDTGFRGEEPSLIAIWHLRQAAKKDLLKAQYVLGKALIDLVIRQFNYVEEKKIEPKPTIEEAIKWLRIAYDRAETNESVRKDIITHLEKISVSASPGFYAVPADCEFMAKYTVGVLTQNYKKLYDLTKKRSLQFVSLLSLEDDARAATIKKGLDSIDPEKRQKLADLQASKYTRGFFKKSVFGGPKLPSPIADLIMSYNAMSISDANKYLKEEIKKLGERSSPLLLGLKGSDEEEVKEIVKRLNNISQPGSTYSSSFKEKCAAILDNMPFDVAEFVVPKVEKRFVLPEIKLSSELARGPLTTLSNQLRTRLAEDKLVLRDSHEWGEIIVAMKDKADELHGKIKSAVPFNYIKELTKLIHLILVSKNKAENDKEKIVAVSSASSSSSSSSRKTQENYDEWVGICNSLLSSAPREVVEQIESAMEAASSPKNRIKP